MMTKVRVIERLQYINSNCQNCTHKDSGKNESELAFEDFSFDQDQYVELNIDLPEKKSD